MPMKRVYLTDEQHTELLQLTDTVATAEDYMPATDEQISAARQIYADDDLQIDDDAGISETDNGYWVQAWVFVKTYEEDEEE